MSNDVQMTVASHLKRATLSLNAIAARWFGFSPAGAITCAPTSERSTSIARFSSTITVTLSAIFTRGARRVPR